MKKPREQDTVTAILKFLALHRIPAWRVTTGATKIGGRFVRFGAVGMADIVAVLPAYRGKNGALWLPGRFMAIEVKSATGRVSPAQQRFLDTVNAAGGKAFVAKSVADVAQELGLSPQTGGPHDA